ncbi:Cactin [Phaffia rhodozyma]|uniref:Splicing factor Cactin n=1 Tax=Phaffia rhodozyma TaxID=264483 RepID=A0A0F7SYR0_PHARH|nr:Cactin [Phaffia rhodozyma]
MPRSPSPAPRDRDRERDRDSRPSSSRKDRSRSRERSSRKYDDLDDRDRRTSSSHRDYHDDRRRDRDRDRDDETDRGREKSSKKRDRSRDREEKKDKKDKKRHRSRSKSPSAKSAKKEAKAAARREKEAEDARAIAELSMYTSTDNPFHDANLGTQFKWVKKAEKDKKAGISLEESSRRDAIRRVEAKEELERLNKRRAEREEEMQLREEEESRMARLAESAMMEDWINKEDDFHLEQARRRAGIRMKENRAKAIDFLAINLRFAQPYVEEEKHGLDKDDSGWGWDDAGLEMDIEEPYKIFDNLTLADTEELREDINMYLSLEKSPSNIEFWQSMLTVCTARLRELRSATLPEESRPNPAVEAEISNLLSGKSLVQLEQLEGSVQAKLSSGEPVDTDYWEGLLRSLQVWKARAKLHAMHEVVLQNRLEQLRLRQREDALKVQSDVAALVSSTQSRLAAGETEFGADLEDIEEETAEGNVEEVWDEEEMEIELVDPKKFSYEDRLIVVLEEDEVFKKLFAQRRQITSTKFVPRSARPNVNTGLDASASAADLQAEALYRAEAAKKLDEDEEIFNIEEGLGNVTSYTWQDKYRPRKPRYFNRVHTGFEWNKYNQTHYDSDNPPPKVVQGYKFNIFYPDLINNQEAPTYVIVRDKEEPEIATIIFKAGPPYEDIAFKIVNKEWEHSHKRFAPMRQRQRLIRKKGSGVHSIEVCYSFTSTSDETFTESDRLPPFTSRRSLPEFIFHRYTCVYHVIEHD